MLNAPRALAASFALTILVGGVLLWLPASHGAGRHVGFLDALFTSTSAVCVTGLVVVDTGKDFSLFGQAVIMGLIQVGGLGIMTFSTLLVLYMGGTVSMRFHMLLREALNRTSFHNLLSIAKMIILITLVIEALGAALLFSRFARDLPLPQAVWQSVFHSVSAFCNAGFSPFPTNLSGYYGDITINLVIPLLIILGGIGFPVIIETLEYRRSRKLSVHTKLVLTMTLALIVVGTLGIFLFELVDNAETYRAMTKWEMLLTAFFQSVSARTAGFNTIDIGRMTSPSLFLLMILMYVGASPSGTGGGVKTTTFGVMLASMLAIIRGRKDAGFFGRRLSRDTQNRSFTISIIYMGMVVAATLMMSIGKDHGLDKTLFEVFSAMGTVGLSTGITPLLTPIQKALIILCMFSGRVGPLTIAMAFVEREGRQTVRHPVGEILIG